MLKNQSVAKKITFFLVSFRAGGGERVMIELANGFLARGFTVDFVVIKPVGQYKDHVTQGVNLFVIDAGRIIFSLPKLINYLKKEKPDVIMAVDEYTHLMTLIAKIISRSNVYVVLRIGNMYSVLYSAYKRFRDKIIPILAKILYKRANSVICVSEGVAKDVLKLFNIPKEKVHTIGNPKNLLDIETKAKAGITHPWFVNKTVPIILATGRLRFQKNFPLLLSAFADVIKKIPCRLVILGAGRDEKELEKIITDLNLSENVLLTGYVDNPYSYMSKADIFILSSRWEGMPNALLEAMACGLPIISTDCDSGPREILAPSSDVFFRIKDGIEYAENGILVPSESKVEIVNATVALLKDSNLRIKYSRKSLTRIKDFDREHILDEYAKAMKIK